MKVYPNTFLSSLLPIPSASRHRLSRRVLPALTLFVLMLAFVLTACGGSSSTTTSNTLLFGAPISLTGSTSTEGHLTLEGYQLWVKELNAHGGIKVGGTTYQVQLKYYDDGSSPTKSAQLTQQLVASDKVNFLLGPYGTAATLQDEAIAEQYKIPMVEGNGAAKAIFSKGLCREPQSQRCLLSTVPGQHDGSDECLDCSQNLWTGCDGPRYAAWLWSRE